MPFDMLKYVRRKLAQADLYQLARDIPIGVRTLYRMLNEEVDPLYSNVQKVYEHFRKEAKR